MPKKATRWRVAPLQRIIAESITDPAEQAAIDRVRQAHKRREQKKSARSAKSK